jgi:hypothetical protein
MTRWLTLVLFFLPVAGALAHPLAPALLELREVAPQRYDILWRTSVSRVQSTDVQPRLPEECAATSAPRPHVEDDALVARWSLQCPPPGLEGRVLAIDGLERSGITVILRLVDANGRVSSELLGPERPSLVIAAPLSSLALFGRYVQLGVSHLWFGLDHLLFVAGLTLLVRRLRALIGTVTAFTLGHSVTLSLVTLGLVHVNSAVMELGIAATILTLACELARPEGAKPTLLARKPWWMAGSFGLVHGMGFASALAETGLPPDSIALPLAGFNIGIELGQLSWVAVLLGGAALLRTAPLRLPLARVAAIYVIGGLAAFWCYERLATVLERLAV